MINNLKIFNFQSHEKTNLEFSPGVNIIIGSSDEGKSVIMRCFEWLINNRPLGTSFISWWNIEKEKIKDSTKVEMSIDDNKIVRERTELFNGYKVDEKELEALKGNVPDEVKDILNFTEVNMQKQFDRPFLLSESAGEVARFFNFIIKIDDIDKMLSLVEQKKRKTRSDLKYKVEDQEKTELELKQLDWIENIEMLLVKAERIESKIKEDKEKYDNLKYLIEDYTDCKNKIVDIDFETVNEKIDEVNSLNKKIEDDEKKADILEDLINSYKAIEQYLNMYEGVVDELKVKVEKVNKIKDDNEKLNKDYKLLKRLIEDYKDLELDIDDQEKEIKELKSQYPEVCPLCGNKIKKGE